MTKPLSEGDYFTPPPLKRPYGAPRGFQPAPAPSGSAPSGSAPSGSAAPAAVRPGLSPSGPLLAGPGWRLLARTIDMVVVSVIAAPILVPLFLRYFRHIVDKLQAVATASAAGHQVTPDVYDSTTVRLVGWMIVTWVAVSFAYEVPQLARWGQTLGKRACRIRVVRRDGAERLGLPTAVIRWLVSGLAPNMPFIGLPLGLLDGLWLLWDRPWRQCLHDKAASTIVIVPR